MGGYCRLHLVEVWWVWGVMIVVTGVIVRSICPFLWCKKPQKFLWTKIFVVRPDYQISFGPKSSQIFSKILFSKHSLSWYSLSKIVLNPDSSAPSERAGVCREKDQMSTFYRTYLLKVSMSSTPLIRLTMTCQGFYYFKEWLRKN